MQKCKKAQFSNTGEFGGFTVTNDKSLATTLWIGQRASHTHVRQESLAQSPGLVTSQWIEIVLYLVTSLLNALHRNSRGASQGRDLILDPVNDQYLAADLPVAVHAGTIVMKTTPIQYAHKHTP
ncbi:hypothetical protein DAPPUDRAFT_260042 [Daphnia pulex]|uniref:Uncharacterized protein n=1 Tax=Daphnia pulex TaxID=6669 RepID=E9HID6_DAPPU|nr:hypothetical protein DAPPUDRAFT_260042 [Daphnia pulex]|eukprot:EFX68512.1 hypothetical protein DAPPUDRAFT_260042 [Daphnia pulex]